MSAGTVKGCAKLGLSGGGGRVAGLGDGGNLKYEAGSVAILTFGTVPSRPSQSKTAVTDIPTLRWCGFRPCDRSQSREHGWTAKEMDTWVWERTKGVRAGRKVLV